MSRATVQHQRLGMWICGQTGRDAILGTLGIVTVGETLYLVHDLVDFEYKYGCREENVETNI